MDEFKQAYIEALHFTDTGHDSEIPDDTELSDEALQQIDVDCAKFLERVQGMPPAWAEIQDRMGDAGHDFWLTRNGHGAGFWDGDWSSDCGIDDMLDGLAGEFGEAWPYLGDDGLIYFL